MAHQNMDKDSSRSTHENSPRTQQQTLTPGKTPQNPNMGKTPNPQDKDKDKAHLHGQNPQNPQHPQHNQNQPKKK